jgi:hypothetical protein
MQIAVHYLWHEVRQILTTILTCFATNLQVDAGTISLNGATVQLATSFASPFDVLIRLLLLAVPWM